MKFYEVSSLESNCASKFFAFDRRLSDFAEDIIFLIGFETRSVAERMSIVFVNYYDVKMYKSI